MRTYPLYQVAGEVARMQGVDAVPVTSQATLRTLNFGLSLKSSTKPVTILNRF